MFVFQCFFLFHYTHNGTNPPEAGKSESLKQTSWFLRVSEWFSPFPFPYKSHMLDRRDEKEYEPYTSDILQCLPALHRIACEHDRDDDGYVFALVEP